MTVGELRQALDVPPEGLATGTRLCHPAAPKTEGAHPLPA
jgi:hypothetical protein